MVEGDAQDPVNPKPVVDPLLGRTLNDRFRILEPIGSGGMGKVYKAVQSPLDRVVALKVLNPNFPAERDPNFKRRFLLEASLTSKLRHPNTVTVIDYGQTDDAIFYIAMEYLEGQTLSEVLHREKILPWTRAFQIAQQICRSLREAHHLGVVHRDLKPANVMLLTDEDHDVVKVLDFGLVKSFANDGAAPGVEVTQQGTFLGSPQYMAPEQARNVTDPRSDIYSTGILLYQMMVGRPPFTGKDYLEVIFQHLKEPAPPFLKLRPDNDVPGEVEAVVQKCLAKDPAARYQTMDEMLDAMRIAAAMAGSSGIFPDRTSPGFRIPAGLSGTPPPLPRPPLTPSPQPTARATPAPAPRAQTPMQPRPAVPPSAPPLFAAARSLDTDASSTVAIDLSLEDERPAHGNKKLWIALAFIAFVAIGFMVVLMATRPPKGNHPPVASQAPAPVKPAPVNTAGPQPAPAPAPEEAAQVHFHVNSDPKGAHVWLGRKDLGVTPLVFDVPAGPDGTVTKEIVFTLDGYYPLNVVAGGSHDVVLMQNLQKRPHARVSSRTEDRAPTLEAPSQLQEPTPVQATPTSPAGPATVTASGTPGASVTPAVSTGSPAPVTPVAVAAAPKPPPVTVLPFGDGMVPPSLENEGEPIRYTREALAAKVEGVMIAKCLITTSGTVQNCRVIKPVPLMEQAVLSSLTSRKYSPITFQGRPVAVDYVFTIRLVLPHH